MNVPTKPKSGTLSGAESAYGSIPSDERIRCTEWLKAQRLSDVERWSNPVNFKSNWSERASIVANLIPEGSCVLDLGCGQMDLERCLDSTSKYIPADLAPHEDRIMFCDLNRGIFPEVLADVVTMLGVIEYIHDPTNLFRSIASRWPKLFMTYNPTDLDSGRDRRIHGWFCNLTSAQMVAAATGAGFDLIGLAPVDTRQLIYEFRSSASG